MRQPTEMSIKMTFHDGSSLEYEMTGVDIDPVHSWYEWNATGGFMIWISAKAGRVLKIFRGDNGDAAAYTRLPDQHGGQWGDFDATSGGS